MPETAQLIVARLTVSSSYGQNVERPAGETFDTVQFYLPGLGDAVYRVRTFAIDHDIHVHQIGCPADRAQHVARGHLDRVYGQVIAAVATVALTRRSTQDLRDAGITFGNLEVASQGRFAFWNPDGLQYATKSEPAGPGEREGMAEVVYLGGLARFWLPDSWRIEMSTEDGGCFYDPSGDSALRLSVLTVDTSKVSEPPRPRHPLRPGERAIDGGRLGTGHEFEVYEWENPDEGFRQRFWQITQLLPGQSRIYLFSYMYAADEADRLAAELAMVDREVRRMVPYPGPR